MSRVGILLFLTTVFLAFTGVFILYESSSYTAFLHIGDKYHFVKNQLVWVFLGMVLSIIVSLINYKIWYKFALPFLGITAFLLVLVFVPGLGLELKGANRWIDLGFIVLQPSELLKITLTLYLAAWLSLKEKGRLLAFLMLVGFCTFLVIAEPDLGTSLVIVGTSLIVYFLSGSSIKELALIICLAVVAVSALIVMEPYRLARLTAFQNFNSQDLSGTSYHVEQILIALGSGGLTGVGFGQSTQKYAYLPENTTDSIFAIYAEEAGFIGSFFLLSIFFLQLTLGFIIAVNCPDKFGRLLAAGIVSYLAIQTIINIASQAVLVPLTGIPLPFISYGGSSMVINFIAIGLVLSIARTIKTKTKNVNTA